MLGLLGSSTAFSLHRPLVLTRQRAAASPLAVFGFGAPKEKENEKENKEPVGQRGVPEQLAQMQTPKTLSQAKQNFQATYGRPVGPIAQGFVNEMLSSCTIAMASPSFLYNPIFALGIDALCDTFLEGMSSAAEKDELRDALITALGLDVKQVLQDASSLRAIAEQCTTEEELLQAAPLAAIAALPAVPPFKYSYAFGAGLLTLMPMVDVEPSDLSIERWCSAINVPSKKLIKDWNFFESSIDKLAEARVMMAEMKAAAKRKEAAKLKEQAEAAAKEAEEAEATSANA